MVLPLRWDLFANLSNKQFMFCYPHANKLTKITECQRINSFFLTLTRWRIESHGEEKKHHLISSNWFSFFLFQSGFWILNVETSMRYKLNWDELSSGNRRKCIHSNENVYHNFNLPTIYSALIIYHSNLFHFGFALKKNPTENSFSIS